MVQRLHYVPRFTMKKTAVIIFNLYIIRNTHTRARMRARTHTHTVCGAGGGGGGGVEMSYQEETVITCLAGEN